MAYGRVMDGFYSF